MDGLLVLMALVALAIPVAIIALLIGQGALKRRVSALESALRDVQAKGVVSFVATEPDTTVPAAATEPAASEPATTEPQAEASGPVADVQPESAAVPMLNPDGTSPWDRAVKASKAKRPSSDQDQPIVLRPDRFAALAGWFKVNWVYAVSALSLALAGVFFVQYGIEKGLLPPEARVSAAILFGAALVAAGEWLRRRHGDEGAHRSAQLPSVFSGAGLVSIFSAILAARQMYGLIGPETAFAGHLLTAALAVVLGWFYGPLLVAVGLLGAAASPFIVAGGSEAGPWLYGYFALIAAVGLAVDAVRRWAWVSVLALVLAYGGAALVLQAGAGVEGWIAALVGLAVMAVILPVFQPLPRHEGPAVILAIVGKGAPGWPPFPVRLAAGAALVTTLGLVLLAGNPEGEAMLALAALMLLALAFLFWAESAAGLVDLAYLPAIGLLASLALQGSGKAPILQAYWSAAADLRAPEVAAPMTISLLLGMAVLVDAGFAWRSFRAGPLRLADGLAASLMAPVTAATLDLLWEPARVIGAYPWALHIIALAAAMVALALGYAKRDGADHRRFAYATLSALSLIALSLFLVATSVALTLALGVLVVVAAGLDRRFDLREMQVFIQAGAAVLWYRLFADPGIDWGMIAPIGTVVLAFGGSIVSCLLARHLLAPRGRSMAAGVLESAAAGLIAVLGNIVITRELIPRIDANGLQTHWGATVNAMPWLILMLVQIYRIRLGGPMTKLRQAIAAVAALVGGGGVLMAVGPYNPLASLGSAARVMGPSVFDSLALAYALPGAMLVLAGWKMPGLVGRLRLALLGMGAALLALFAGLEIRRYWQGDWLGVPGVVQGELYSYTVALMVVGAALLFLAIKRRSGLLRRIAMAVIGLTIVKVFLLDAAGLTGLTRVASFLGLGLSLAGLAWLNRWAGQVSAPSEK